MTVADTTATPSKTDTSFLDALEDALDDAGASDEHVDAVVAEGQQLISERDQLRQRVDELQAELDEVDDYVRDSLDHAAMERAELASRVDTLESAENGANAGEEAGSADTDSSSADETTLHDTVTRLEEVVAYPEEVAERELSANQRRARDVARDVYDYTRKVPSGRVIATPELKRVLTALKEIGSASYKTVGRVVDFLTKFGEGEVTTTTRENGDTVVVFTDELAERLTVHGPPRHGDSVVSGKARAD
jgi:chromosome segregation ATPase